MNMTLKPAFGLSGSALKIIAMISMVIDHVALYLMDDSTVLYETMRCIGRIAFPVFAFLIAEGFIHTRSRYRYFFTLLGFAVISEIPWYLLNGADGTHNVMFTLALGVATLMVSIRPTTGIKPLYTTIATVTMNLIVSAAIVLLNQYITVCISY